MNPFGPACRRGLAAAVLATALAPASASPARPVGYGGDFVTATLVAGGSGVSSVSVMLPRAPADSAAVVRAMERGIGLRFEAVDGGPDEDGGWGCVAVLPGTNRVSLDPAALAGLAGQSGARATLLDLWAPRGLPTRVEGGAREPWRSFARRHHPVSLVVGAPLPPPARLRFGFTPADRALAAAHALALFLVPLLVVAFVLHRARRVEPGTSAAVYFSSAHTLGALPGAVALATVTAWDTPLANVLRLALTPWLGPYAVAAVIGAQLLPVATSIAAATWALHRVTVATRGDDLALAERFAQSAWAFAGLTAMAGGFAGVWLALELQRLPLAVAGLAFAVAGALFAQHRLARRIGLDPQAVTSGPLRDRVVALAARAGVRLQQLHVVPMSRVRMANAFAVRGDTVLLTDWLLENLGRREVDAVLAHELAHLQLGHPRKLGLVAMGTAVIVATAGSLLELPGNVVAAALAAVIVTRHVSRRFEYAADARAVAIGGDAEALVTGLARISRLNHVPLDWSRASERALTHPSTLRRAQAIARAAGIPDERLRELLAHEGPPIDRDSVPAPAVPGARCFSTGFKRATAMRLGWLLLLGSGAAASCGVALVRALGAPRALAVPLAALLAFAVLLVLTDLLAARGIAALRPAIARRQAPPAGARFVGLSPGAGTRVYEGYFDWDLGHLWVEGDALVFRGEESEVRLPRAAITGVRRAPGPPGWIAAPRVAVEWADDTGGAGDVLQFRVAHEPRLRGLPAATDALVAELRAWHARGTGGRVAGPWATPPREGDVTAATIAAIAHPRTLVPVAVLLALTCALLAWATRLPLAPWSGAGALEAWTGAFAAAVLQRVPGWRAPRLRAAAPPEADRRAA